MAIYSWDQMKMTHGKIYNNWDRYKNMSERTKEIVCMATQTDLKG